MSLKATRLPAGAAVAAFPWGRAPIGAPGAAGSSSGGVDAASAAEIAAERAAASERLAVLERDAFMKGYAQGERSGEEAAARQGEAMLRRLAETIEEVAALRVDLMRRAERELVRLALAIAERIVRREVSLDRDLVVAMARVAIERLGERVSATIRLNPLDFAALAAGTRAAQAPGPVQITADPMVSRGGCLVQSDFGLMDVSVEAQLLEISRGLFGSDTPDTPAGSEHAVVVVPGG